MIQYKDGRESLGVGTTVAVWKQYQGLDVYGHYAVYQDAAGDWQEVRWDSSHLDYEYVPSAVATVDASPELQQAWQRYCDMADVAERAWRGRQECVADAKRLRRGVEVVVVKGRKVPVGTRGVCIWTGVGQWGERVGLKDAAGAVHFTASSNVEVSVEVLEAALQEAGYVK